VLATLSSCRGVRPFLPRDKFDHISTNDILDSVIANDIQYESIFFRRLIISVNSPEFNRSVRANMYIRRDSVIILSVIPVMGIELYRVALNNDNFVVIDRVNRRVIRGGYDYFHDFVNVPVTFKNLEQILTNKFFFLPGYSLAHLNRVYELNSDSLLHFRFIGDKLASRSSRPSTGAFNQTVSIRPDNFRIISSILQDVSTGAKLTVGYSDFTRLQGKYYFPTQITLKGAYQAEFFSLGFNFSQVEIDNGQYIPFVVPASYEKVSF